MVCASEGISQSSNLIVGGLKISVLELSRAPVDIFKQADSRGLRALFESQYEHHLLRTSE